jgi:cold shock CspA family protein
MAQGRIKTLHVERGYGFIAVDGESAELYFQRDSVVEDAFADLRAGQRVDFTVTPDPLKTDRMRAEHIRRVE